MDLNGGDLERRNMDWRDLKRRNERSRMRFDMASTSTPFTSSMVPASSLHLSLLLPSLLLLCLLLLLETPLSILPFLLLLTLQIFPLLREDLTLCLEGFSIHVGVAGVCVLSFELSFKLLHIAPAAHLMRIVGPQLEAGDVNGQLLVLKVVVIGERADGRRAR